MSTWFLAIDFGTTNTCAAVVDDRGTVAVGFGPEQLSRMPSGVLLRTDGGLLVGFEAERQASIHPDRFDAAPKRSVGQAALLLGDREVPVVVAVAAVLGAAAAEARRQHGGTPPAQVSLTYPARWGSARQAVLRDAATRAGLGDVSLISEPEAAAAYFAKHDRVPIGRPVAVYDLGGGTLDTAVLTATRSGFRILGRPGGIDPLGGDDVDERLLELTLDRVRASVPAGAAPTSPDHLGEPSGRADARREVRRAKEDLATSDVTELVIPGSRTSVELSRADLRTAAGRDVDASVTELLRTVALAGVALDQLAAVYLAGGSSRLPLVRESLTRQVPPAVQRVVRTLHDPKVAVAQGAVEILHGRETTPEASPAEHLTRARPANPLTPLQRVAAAMAVLLLVVAGGGVWLHLRDSNVLSGTVYDSAGDPLPGIELQLYSDGQQLDTMTDAHGRYHGKLKRGSYAIEAYGIVQYEGRAITIQLSPRKADSEVFDVPAGGGVHLDLDLSTSGRRPGTSGGSAGDYFGSSVDIQDAFDDDGSVAPLSAVRSELSVTFHFEPTGPRADGTPSEAFDVTRTVGELVSGTSDNLDHDSVLYDIPLADYEVSATLETPSGPIPLLVEGYVLSFGDTAVISLAMLCDVGCGDTTSGSATLLVGIDPRYL